MTDSELRKELAKVLALAEAYGTRSEEVRSLVLRNEDDEFRSLAATLLVCLEDEELKQ